MAKGHFADGFAGFVRSASDPSRGADGFAGFVRSASDSSRVC